MNWDYVWVFIIISSGLWFTYLIVVLGNHLINTHEHRALSEYYKAKAKAYNELITQKESYDGAYRTRNISGFNEKSETKSKK